MQKVIFRDIGLIDYKEGWDYQEKLFDSIIRQKRMNRELPGNVLATDNYLLFCEHPHVYTLGKSGVEANLLINAEELTEKSASFYKINRGGDITYHGPGQIVGYPILNLDLFFTDIHKYLRYLEEAVILTLAGYGVKGERYPGFTGVWIDATIPEKARKICAMGVRCSRWVTMHGFAFNVNTNLDYFRNIVPCGIDDKKVTSLAKELGMPVSGQEVKERLKEHLSTLFGMELVNNG
jgi:lipoyl(octanoyl) transferase